MPRVQIPEDPSDSFFMNMDYDPLEGPSWLCDSSDVSYKFFCIGTYLHSVGGLGIGTGTVPGT